MPGTLFSRLYPGLLSAISLVVILWLTLAPHPVPVPQDMFFPHADKLVHFLMFGGLMLCVIIDRDLWYQRRYEQTGLLPRHQHMTVVFGAVAVVLLGGLIEVLQELMGEGRGGDPWDFLADVAGTVVFSLISPRLAELVLHFRSR